MKEIIKRLYNLKKLYLNITKIQDNNNLYIDVYTNIFVFNSFIKKWIYDLKTFYWNQLSDNNKELIINIDSFIKLYNMKFDIYNDDYIIITGNNKFKHYGSIVDKNFKLLIETNTNNIEKYTYENDPILDKMIVTSNKRILSNKEQQKLLTYQLQLLDRI